MRVSSVATVVLAALLPIPSAASAQLAGGRSGSSSERWITGGREVFDDLNEFGRCFAARQTKEALRLVRPEAGSADEARVYKALFSKEQACLGDLAGLAVPWQYVRGAVAEGVSDLHRHSPVHRPSPGDGDLRYPRRPRRGGDRDRA